MQGKKKRRQGHFLHVISLFQGQSLVWPGFQAMSSFQVLGHWQTLEILKFLFKNSKKQIK